MNAADPPRAFSERGEEAQEFFAAHARAVVGDGPAIDAFLLHCLPLNAEFDLGGPSFLGVFKEFARPLVIAACLEHAISKDRRADDGEFHSFSSNL
ncbi:MAG: hypothetical protein WAM72_08080 [Xanthobacteraceae bacterium]